MSRKADRGLGAALVMLTMVATVRGADDQTRATAGGDLPVGWAAVEGGTTGGQGGATVTVSDADGSR